MFFLGFWQRPDVLKENTNEGKEDKEKTKVVKQKLAVNKSMSVDEDEDLCLDLSNEGVLSNLRKL